MGWGISPNASKKEQIKANLTDELSGLNSSGDLSFAAYNQVYDLAMKALDDMYDLHVEEKQNVQPTPEPPTAIIYDGKNAAAIRSFIAGECYFEESWNKEDGNHLKLYLRDKKQIIVVRPKDVLSKRPSGEIYVLIQKKKEEHPCDF